MIIHNIVKSSFIPALHPVASVMAKRDRTNASKADVQSKRMCIDLDSTKPTRASNTNVFRLLDLPAEIRVNVCKHIFSPMSSSDKHAALHDPCLSLTWVNDGSAAQVQLHKRSGFHFSRPTDYKFLFTSKQIYAEALPILARSTSLRLSGTTYHELQKLLRNDPNLKYLIHLFNEVGNNTSHLIIDQPVLRTDLSFRDNLVHGTLFPNLQKLTVHQAGPAQLSTAREEDALTDEEAATLAISRKWQCQKWERDFALVFDSLNAVSCRWMLDHHPLVSFPFMLCALTADLTTSKNDSLRRRHKLDTVEVVWSVGIKGLVTSAQGEHVVFNKAVGPPPSPRYLAYLRRQRRILQLRARAACQGLQYILTWLRL